ncbi:UDP-glucose 4-epimerase GalE [Bradyrhizobium canariense]|uniref:UDP-glucose 4-epimerase n=1 Tax=Bradyrhizobium canariense TaxID=255045 RepID=A0A1H2BJ16_9BRAD|nr:UDP-glucose 4-epimerase GalE [Bradyrhizobium canariense]SDT58231.1 UDP-galactose 4-epimerase [Bradyrhizobium canariense]
MKIMVTGGAGYIGSHTCIELIDAGHQVVIFDNFSNSNVEVVRRIERITGTAPLVVRGDVRDRDLLTTVLATHHCEAVIHFAGLKSVAESVSHPLLYYENNVLGSMRLVQAMKDVGVNKLVFSSSATVYGDPIFLPLTEDHPKSPYSPYGRTKLVVEDMLTEVAQSTEDFRIAILRYFNPVGCHASGLIGEDPLGVPSNLMPFIAQVAVGRRPHVNIFGNDYSTPDGTGIRDYVHVTDLATGHLRALEHLGRQDFLQVNLGTGRGSSVLDLVRAFSKACGKDIPFVFSARREGDVASYYACTDLAHQLLGWRATRKLHDMCVDTWRWQSRNPNGYDIAPSQASA